MGTSPSPDRSCSILSMARISRRNVSIRDLRCCRFYRANIDVSALHKTKNLFERCGFPQNRDVLGCNYFRRYYFRICHLRGSSIHLSIEAERAISARSFPSFSVAPTACEVMSMSSSFRLATPQTRPRAPGMAMTHAMHNCCRVTPCRRARSSRATSKPARLSNPDGSPCGSARRRPCRNTER